ncbi:hypothetical protein [Azospirillum argentinense]
MTMLRRAHRLIPALAGLLASACAEPDALRLPPSAPSMPFHARPPVAVYLETVPGPGLAPAQDAPSGPPEAAEWDDLLASPAALPAWARREVDTTVFAGGTSVRRGDLYVRSNGGWTRRSGDRFEHSDGGTTIRRGDTYVHSDGRWSRRVGDTVTTSDGRVCTIRTAMMLCP